MTSQKTLDLEKKDFPIQNFSQTSKNGMATSSDQKSRDGNHSVEIQETFRVASPIDKVFGFLTDMSNLAKCITGGKMVADFGGEESTWKIEMRAGFLSQTIVLTARIKEIRRPDFIAFEAREAKRGIKIAGHVHLTDKGDSTLLNFSVGIESIDLFRKRLAQQRIQEWSKNLKAALENR